MNFSWFWSGLFNNPLTILTFTLYLIKPFVESILSLLNSFVSWPWDLRLTRKHIWLRLCSPARYYCSYWWEWMAHMTHVQVHITRQSLSKKGQIAALKKCLKTVIFCNTIYRFLYHNISFENTFPLFWILDSLITAPIDFCMVQWI